MNQAVDRRTFERFALRPMYTGVRLRTLDEAEFTHQGHAHDVSEGGLRFEMDEPIAPGTPVAVQIELPLPFGEGEDDGVITVVANVIWCDTEEPGAAQMAAAITRFDRADDRMRLLHHLGSGRFFRAA